MTATQFDHENQESNQRTLASVQICLHCKKIYLYKRGRKLCPRCLCTLKNTVTVQKIKVCSTLPISLFAEKERGQNFE
jgi:hypothetical protein